MKRTQSHEHSSAYKGWKGSNAIDPFSNKSVNSGKRAYKCWWKWTYLLGILYMCWWILRCYRWILCVTGVDNGAIGHQYSLLPPHNNAFFMCSYVMAWNDSRFDIYCRWGGNQRVLSVKLIPTCFAKFLTFFLPFISLILSLRVLKDCSCDISFDIYRQYLCMTGQNVKFEIFAKCQEYLFVYFNLNIFIIFVSTNLADPTN